VVGDTALTLFEFVSVAFSLILSFSVVRLLGGASDAFAVGRRYWIHCSWVCLQIVVACGAWWVLWSYRTAEWNFLLFLLILASPSLLYFQASALIPSDPSTVDSWKDHYFRSRRRFFGAGVLSLVLVGVQSYVFLDFPLVHPRRALNLLVIAALLAAAVSRRESVHRIVVAAFAIAMILLFSVFVFNPEGWALQR